jgi:histidinol-phosphate aminotransferase
MYPEYRDVTRRLARYFRVSPNELLLANGGDDSLHVFFDTFVDPGSGILICDPTFPMYRYYAEIFGAKIHVLRYDAEMRFPLAAVCNALRRKPRVLFIANPNNPTGTLLSRQTIETILRATKHTAVVIDEAYAEYSGATVVPLIRKYPHLFIARTFSKAAGLAGLRLGAVIGCAPSLQFLRSAMPPFPVNVAALIAADAAVRDRRTMQRHIQNTLRSREWLHSQLARIGVKTYPSAGNFLLANFGLRGPALFRKLARHGILVRDRSSDLAVGFVRITIGSQPEMRRLMHAIRQYYSRSPGFPSLTTTAAVTAS